MDLERLYRDLPAIHLVFGHSTTTHTNVSKNPSNDCREWSLLNLLIDYLRSVSVTEQVPDWLLTLLQQWSNDLVTIYGIRSSANSPQEVAQFSERLLWRIRSLRAGKYAIIPNGLISEKDNGSHEHICLAVLTSPSPGRLDWVQIDPGSPYHQRCQTPQTIDSDPCLVINNIDMRAFNKEWLELLIGLKANGTNLSESHF